jgi:hypothetical protein
MAVILCGEGLVYLAYHQNSLYSGNNFHKMEKKKAEIVAGIDSVVLVFQAL